MNLNMRGKHGAVVTKNSYSLTGVTWSLIFMLVFCFAGCAAGSCLSYGHSCWGAHGKRSGNNFGSSNLRMNEDNKNIVLPLVNDQWMLSPLINKRHPMPSSGKYRVRWMNILKGKSLPSRDWDSNESIASKEENDITRNINYRLPSEKNERFLKNTESNEESKESEGFLHESTEPFVNDDSSEEIILLPKNRETNDNSRQFRFMKIMRNTNANLK
ncbi:uncharacterized protein LOC127280449 isoform X2 [Leptopilina boulardi]|uniref:uncharacterized protein LOC127280449 isoform X2 n=1 Tax=Leptopilina boulardi TaxID=63433 RepID=UPI0021F5A7E6|nr:uncharacterized protein LOC127280449 isoform X2 [Leptopilina boulardi]